MSPHFKINLIIYVIRKVSSRKRVLLLDFLSKQTKSLSTGLCAFALSEVRAKEILKQNLIKNSINRIFYLLIISLGSFSLPCLMSVQFQSAQVRWNSEKKILREFNKWISLRSQTFMIFFLSRNHITKFCPEIISWNPLRDRSSFKLRPELRELAEHK